MCYYNHGKNYVYPTKDELTEQIPGMKKRFLYYKEYAKVNFEETFSKEELKDVFVVKAECFESSYLENKSTKNRLLQEWIK